MHYLKDKFGKLWKFDWNRHKGHPTLQGLSEGDACDWVQLNLHHMYGIHSDELCVQIDKLNEDLGENHGFCHCAEMYAKYDHITDINTNTNTDHITCMDTGTDNITDMDAGTDTITDMDTGTDTITDINTNTDHITSMDTGTDTDNDNRPRRVKRPKRCSASRDSSRSPSLNIDSSDHEL